MKIYQIHIIKFISPVFFLTTFFITAVAWLFHVLKLLPLLIKGAIFTTFGYISILVIPSLLFIILPLTYCISVVYSYYKLQHDRELVTLFNSGLSNIQIAMPALYLAAFVMIINYCISCYFLPLSYGILKEQTHLLKSKLIYSVVQIKVFNPLSKNITLYADKQYEDSSFSGILLIEHHEKHITTTFAQKGYLTVNDDVVNLKLYNGVRQDNNKLGQISNLSFENLVVNVPIKASYNYNFNMIKKGLREYYWPELLFPDKRLDQEFIQRMQIEMHQRILWPFYVLLLPTIALAIFFRSDHTGKKSYKSILKITIAILSILIIYFMSNNFAMQYSSYIIYLYLIIISAFIISVIFMQRRVL